jgi:hypothetical protein
MIYLSGELGARQKEAEIAHMQKQPIKTLSLHEMIN